MHRCRNIALVYVCGRNVVVASHRSFQISSFHPYFFTLGMVTDRKICQFAGAAHISFVTEIQNKAFDQDISLYYIYMKKLTRRSFFIAHTNVNYLLTLLQRRVMESNKLLQKLFILKNYFPKPWRKNPICIKIAMTFTMETDNAQAVSKNIYFYFK